MFFNSQEVCIASNKVEGTKVGDAVVIVDNSTNQTELVKISPRSGMIKDMHTPVFPF